MCGENRFRKCGEYVAIVTTASLTYLAHVQREAARPFLALAIVTYVSSSYTCIALTPCSDMKEALSPCGSCRALIQKLCMPQMIIYTVPSDYDERVMRGENDGMQWTQVEELSWPSVSDVALEIPGDL